MKKFTFLTTYWEQAVENAAKLGLPPVLAIKEAKRGGRDCVQIRQDDLARLKGTEPWPDGGRYLQRIPWSTFVRLYIAAYNNNEEIPLGI